MVIALKKYAKIDNSFLVLANFTGFLYSVPNILSRIVAVLEYEKPYVIIVVIYCYFELENEVLKFHMNNLSFFDISAPPFKHRTLKASKLNKRQRCLLEEIWQASNLTQCWLSLSGFYWHILCPFDHLVMWCHVTKQKRYISTFTRSISIKRGTVLT